MVVNVALILRVPKARDLMTSWIKGMASANLIQFKSRGSVETASGSGLCAPDVQSSHPAQVYIIAA